MIRIRSINGDNIRLRADSIQQTDPYFDAGPGPHMPSVGEGGSGPIPARALFDRFNVTLLDRFGVELETRT